MLAARQSQLSHGFRPVDEAEELIALPRCVQARSAPAEDAGIFELLQWSADRGA